MPEVTQLVVEPKFFLQNLMVFEKPWWSQAFQEGVPVRPVRDI